MVEIEEVAPAAPAQGPGAHAFQGTPKKRGNAAFRNGDYAGAVELYAAALEEEGNAPSHTTLCNRSASLFMLGRLEESLADAERAAKIKPGHLKAHYRRGLALQGLLRHAEAARAFEDALKLDAGNAEVTDKLAEARIAADRVSSGAAAAQRPAETLKTPEGSYKTAHSMSAAGAPAPEPAARASQPLGTPTKPQPSQSAADKKQEEPKTPVATAATNADVTASESDAGSAGRDAARRSGNQAFRAGEYAKAVTCYTVALGGMGATGDGAHTLFSNRAASYMQLGNHVASLADADRCIELRPMWVKGHYRRGVALEALARYTDARAAFRAAKEVDPGNVDVRKRLAAVETLLSEAAPDAPGPAGVRRMPSDDFVMVDSPADGAPEGAGGGAGGMPKPEAASSSGAACAAEWGDAMSALSKYRLIVEARVAELERRLERRDAQVALYASGEHAALDAQLRDEGLPFWGRGGGSALR